MICAACGSTTSSTSCSACGQSCLLNERYALESVLDQGVLETTYLGMDVRIDVHVVVREIQAHWVTSEAALVRFREQAAALVNTEIEGLVPVLDTFEIVEGRSRKLFLVDAFVPGHTLADEVGKRVWSGAKALEVVDELALILEQMHIAPVPQLHLDLRPSRVLRRDDNGALMLLGPSGPLWALQADKPGMSLVGRYGYSPPELAKGLVGPQVDAYGLGALAIELLAGRPPSEMMDHANRMSWDRFVRVAAPVEVVLRSMLEIDTTYRAKDATDVRRQVQRVRGMLSHIDENEEPLTAPTIDSESRGRMANALFSPDNEEVSPDAPTDRRRGTPTPADAVRYAAGMLGGPLGVIGRTAGGTAVRALIPESMGGTATPAPIARGGSTAAPLDSSRLTSGDSFKSGPSYGGPQGVDDLFDEDTRDEPSFVDQLAAVAEKPVVMPILLSIIGVLAAVAFFVGLFLFLGYGSLDDPSTITQEQREGIRSQIIDDPRYVRCFNEQARMNTMAGSSEVIATLRFKGGQGLAVAVDPLGNPSPSVLKPCVERAIQAMPVYDAWGVGQITLRLPAPPH